MIQFDLHIHSIASKYKESRGIVDHSTIDNAEVLLEKLNEYDVNLFSITDHNRFNKELYKRLDVLIRSRKFPNVQGIVAGIEFDVKMDLTMKQCHVITIFDAKNKIENYEKIYNVIETHKLENKDTAYSRDRYEEILRDIGMDVILIACQRNDLAKHDGKHNSLSESTMEPKELLRTGYINALEFQRPNVEGILLNNLRDLEKSIMMVMGSDCHDWGTYPNHDGKHGNSQFKHSRANILPTFKGLLMAIKSPQTRINQQENKNHEYIRSIKIKGIEYPLINGMNAIVGENGSGKSTILKLLNGQDKEKYVKDLWRKNNMACDNIEHSKVLYLGQGDIVDQFDKNKLFPHENFLLVDHSGFQSAYKMFANNILQCIKKNIKAKEALDKLYTLKLEYNELINSFTYFIRFDVNADYANIDNTHDCHREKLRKLLSEVSLMKQSEYYQGFSDDLNTIYTLLNRIYTQVNDAYCKIEYEKAVKNALISASSNYNVRIQTAASASEKDQRDYLTKKQHFIRFIIEAVKKNMERSSFPNEPIPISGSSINPKFGFSFNAEAAYHGKDVVKDFFLQMFVKEYSNLDALKKIDKVEQLVEAVKNCTGVEEIDAVYARNYQSFIDKMCSCKNYIVDLYQQNGSLGNTLGELSLAYFRYMTAIETEKCVFLIDQPEDHISNNNISKKLLAYFNSIRNQKQIIIVTHNPLLVVNQDVDQVLFVQKHNDDIQVLAGCLEYEGEDYSMLDIIAKNMDGGKDSIEKRLKVYGKENHSDHVTI